MALDKCKSCGHRLEPGPTQHSSAESLNWRVAVRGIPTRRCPQGCAGLYWYDRTFDDEVLGLLGGDSDAFARGKGFFRTRQLCRVCGHQLSQIRTSGSVSLRGTLRNKSPIELRIEGPLFRCDTCRRDYLPALSATWDNSYWELGDLINEALTRDLIYD